MDFTSTTYRLTAKAIIRNKTGRVLFVEEAGGHRSLPGGGIEHGEDPTEALARELKEELGIQVIRKMELIHAYPYKSQTWNMWWIWLLYTVDAELPTPFIGEHAGSAEFYDVKNFHESSQKSEQRLYHVFTTMPSR